MSEQLFFSLRKCFDEMLKNEKEFCGEWVVGNPESHRCTASFGISGLRGLLSQLLQCSGGLIGEGQCSSSTMLGIPFAVPGPLSDLTLSREGDPGAVAWCSPAQSSAG